jgi:hypothetical protein
MFRSPVKLVCLILLSAAILSIAFAGGEKLRYQMPKGVTHKYKLTTDSKTKAQMMGQDFTTTSWSYFGISLTGEDAGKNSELICVGKVDSNLSKIDSPMMKDTARVMKEINGKRVRLTLSPLGKTVKSEVVDEIPQTQATQMMGGGNPTDFLRRLFVELPEKEAGVGESWKQTRPDTTNAQGMKIITKPDVTFKIAGNESVGGYDCLKITFEGASSQYGTGSRQGMELVLDGTVKSKGTVYFAPKEGLMVSLEQTSANEMNISGTGEQMFTAIQSTTSTSKVVLVK